MHAAIDEVWTKVLIPLAAAASHKVSTDLTAGNTVLS